LSSAYQKLNNIQFCEICGYKKRYDNKFFSPLSFLAVFGSGMGKNQDRGSGINIPDPQHWCNYMLRISYTQLIKPKKIPKFIHGYNNLTVLFPAHKKNAKTIPSAEDLKRKHRKEQYTV
jgi:hypothetical protein